MAANVKVCEHYLRGNCRYGSNCKFTHVENSSSYLRKGIDHGRNVCSFYLRGECKYGSRCKFEHPGPPNGRGGGTKSGRHQEDPFSDQGWSRGMNPYKAFNNFNSRNVNNFGPNASQTGDKGQVQFQNPSQSGYVNHNQPRRQVRFNDSGPQVRLYSQQGTGYRDIDKRNGQTDPPIRRPLFASTGKWLNSEANGGGLGPSPRTTANQPCTPREAMAVIKEDMRCWVEGNMWPLSSYSYSFKSPPLPGLKDYSPEELRWEAYRATASGRLENHKQEVRALRQEAGQWRHHYMSLTHQDTKQLMDRLKFGSRDGNITLEPSGPVFRSPAVVDPNETFFKDRKPTTASGGGVSGAPLGPPQSDKPSVMSNTAPPTALPAVQGSLAVTTTDSDVNKHKISSEDLAAFKAKEFVLGKIPICPPPPELCV